MIVQTRVDFLFTLQSICVGSYQFFVHDFTEFGGRNVTWMFSTNKWTSLCWNVSRIILNFARINFYLVLISWCRSSSTTFCSLTWRQFMSVSWILLYMFWFISLCNLKFLYRLISTKCSLSGWEWLFHHHVNQIGSLLPCLLFMLFVFHHHVTFVFKNVGWSRSFGFWFRMFMFFQKRIWSWKSSWSYGVLL